MENDLFILKPFMLVCFESRRPYGLHILSPGSFFKGIINPKIVVSLYAVFYMKGEILNNVDASVFHTTDRPQLTTID